MSQYITLVVRYEDGQQLPRIGFDTEALGGKVTAFAAGDELSRLEKIEEAVEGDWPFRFRVVEA